MKENIYIVTEGEYSDYRILAVFSNFVKADIYSELVGKDGYGGARVETYTIDNAIVDDRYIYEVREVNCWVNSKRGDTTLSAELLDSDSVEGDVKNSTLRTVYKRDNIFVSLIGDRREYIVYIVFVAAKNEHQAKKIASDLIAKYKANEAGI